MTLALFTRSGAEGPHHDRYSWTELTVARDGESTTLRMGSLGYARLTVAQGRRTLLAIEGEAEARDGFAKLTGLSERQFIRAYHRIRSTCPVCRRRTPTHPMAGFPGETLEICDECGTVVCTDFNEAAII